jgi:hypothetical protein
MAKAKKQAKRAAPSATTAKAKKQTKRAAPSSLPAAVAAISVGASNASLGGDMQIRTDVLVCLMDAITDRFPITRDEIELDLVPSGKEIGADEGGWGVCLQLYASYLRALRPVYGFYVHKPKYDKATLDLELHEIQIYLRNELVAQSGGGQ